MLNVDSDALECDLFETYGIIDYRELPVKKVALFSCGLRDNSRIKMKMSDLKVDINTLLIASAVDRLSMMLWSKTKDAEKGKNKPKMLVSMLLGQEEEKQEFKSFSSPEEFKKFWDSE